MLNPNYVCLSFSRPTDNKLSIIIVLNLRVPNLPINYELYYIINKSWWIILSFCCQRRSSTTACRATWFRISTNESSYSWCVWMIICSLETSKRIALTRLRGCVYSLLVLVVVLVQMWQTVQPKLRSLIIWRFIRVWNVWNTNLSWWLKQKENATKVVGL